MPVDPARAKSLFLIASDKSDAAARDAYLNRECGGDSELRARVEALLRANDAAPLHSQEGTSAYAADRPAPTRDYDDPTARIGSIIGGKYKLVEAVGEGGMGQVFMAQQTEPVKRAVAVKVIKAGMDSKAVLARFEAERQALAMMDHPNIARVLDAGATEGGRPFFVMELVKGTPITQFCDERKLTPKQRLELFVPVCQAIQHAHQKGVIHRDIKPSNVLIALYDDRPVPKVIDFGVAKAAGQTLTEKTLMTGLGAVVGTAEYMSPEQASLNNLDIDTRSDVYSLGVLLYELLTGSTPVDRKSLGKAAVLEILRIVREVDVPRPSAKLSTIDTLPSVAANRSTEPAKLSRLMKGELDWLLLKALEKDRSRRYETANALSRDIQRYLADEVVEARPPSAAYRLKKFVRRHKGRAIAAAAVAAALFAGLVAFAWQANVAREQRDRAIEATEAEAAQRSLADKARTAEAEAHQRTELALDDSRQKTARMTYERAQALCEEGKADLGLLWMSRSLDLTPPGASDLDRVIRTSLNLWAGQLNTVRPLPSKPEWDVIANVSDVVVSPDGLSVLTVGNAFIEQKAVTGTHLWELSSGKRRFELPLEANPPLTGAGYSDGRAAYSPDGRFVASTHGDKRVRIWTASSGRLLGTPIVLEAPVRRIGFDPTGQVLATAVGKNVRFWSVPGGAPVMAPLALDQEPLGVEFSSDDQHLLTWTADKVELWDVKSLKLVRSLAGVDFAVFYACFSPDRKLVLAGGRPHVADPWEYGVCQFWEVATGQPVGTRMKWKNHHLGASYPVFRASFRQDSLVVVTPGFPLRLWQAPSGASLGTTMDGLIYGGAEMPSFRTDGKVIAAIPFGGNKHLLDVGPALEPRMRFENSGGHVAVVVGSDGCTAAGVQINRDQCKQFTRLFDISTGKSVGSPIAMDCPPAFLLCRPVFSPDSRTVAAGVGKFACQLWDSATGRERGPQMIMSSYVHALAFSPDGRLLAAGDRTGRVQFWDASSGKAVGAPITHRTAVNRVSFSPDGRKLFVAGGAIGGADGEARLWDVSTGKPLGPALEILGETHAAAFSPDGKTFATGAFKLILWDAATSRPVWTAGTQSVIRSLCFSPDGQLLVHLVEEGTARLFDARTGMPLGPTLRHRANLWQSSLSPDGRFVLTCGTDQTARLWDAATGLPLGPTWGDLSASAGGAFTADSRGVLLQGNGALLQWGIPEPLEGSPERIRLAVEAAVRSSLDAHGTTKLLIPLIEPDPKAKNKFRLGLDPYEPVRKRLEELGGPPGAFRR